MSPADLLLYPPLCLAICLVWAGTRESSARDVAKHAIVLGLKVTVGLAVLGLALQGVLLVLG